MKRLLTIIISLIIIAISADIAAQTVREIKNVKPFDKISLAAGINLILNKSDQRAVRVEAERTVVSHVICRVSDDGELQVYATKFRYKTSKRINVYVDYDSTLVKIDAPGGNRVRCENPLKTNRIELIARNGCDFYINLASQHVKARATNGSTIKLLGESVSADLWAENSSQLRSYDLVCQRVALTMSIASSAEVFASESLSGTAVSDCEVRYKGSPKENSLEVSSGSKAFAQ